MVSGDDRDGHTSFHAGTNCLSKSKVQEEEHEHGSYEWFDLAFKKGPGQRRVTREFATSAS